MTLAIDWRMGASLENVHRGNIDIAEVANLCIVVRAWHQLDPAHRAAATLTPHMRSRSTALDRLVQR